MGDINQDESSENRPILGSRISQIETIGNKTKKVIFNCESFSEVLVIFAYQ